MSLLELARAAALATVAAILTDGLAGFVVTTLLILAALMTDWIHEDGDKP